MRIITIGVLSLLWSEGVRAQLAVNFAPTPTQLVEDVLLGEGVTAFNILYNNNPAPPNFQVGRGSFTAGTTNLGLTSGVVLSSGNVLQLPGNAAFNMSTTLGTGSDPDLQAVSGANINDRSVLQFDFIPNGDTLRFRYVFGSEEYPEYVCNFNDAFGFFLSGPGFAGPYSNGAVNIARLPNNAPVTINNVNHGLNNNQNHPTCPAQNPAYYVNNATGATIRLDGFTTVLEAFAIVQCGETYRIKLAIGDALDGGWDSAVFLEAGSFAVTGTISAELPAITGVIDGNTMLEGCGPYDITFTRSGDTADELIVDLSVAGTATGGVDYLPAFPTQLIFPAGSATATVTLTVPFDGDPLETLEITIIEPVDCGIVTVETQVDLFIDTADPIDVVIPPVTADCGELVVLEPEVSGALGDYTFLWETSETTPTITVSAQGNTSYEVTVGAACGALPVTVDFPVNIPNYPPLDMTVSGATEIPCLGSATIEVLSASGGYGTYDYTWSDGTNTLGTGPTLDVPSPGPGNTVWYYVTMTDACGTELLDSVEVYMGAVIPLDVSLGAFDPVLCLGENIVLQGIVNGGGGTPVLEWTDELGVVLGTNSILNISPDASETITLTVTDDCGTVSTITADLVVNPPSDAGSNGTVAVCNTGGALPLIGELGGTPQPGGAWSGPSSTGGTFNPLVHIPGQYTYTVPGLPGCPDASATVMVTVNVEPDAGINGDLDLCVTDGSIPLVNSLGGTPDVGGSWTGPSVTNGMFNPAVHQPGAYTYTVTGVAPCPSASATVQVSVAAAANAGSNGVLVACDSGAPTDLFDELGGSPEANGSWSGPSIIPGGNFDPAQHQPGVYTYTVNGQAPCPDASASVTVTVVSEPNAGGDGYLTICANDAAAALINSLEGSPNGGGNWTGPSATNGMFNPAVHQPGTYTYTVTAPAPCPSASATVEVDVVAPANAGTSGNIVLCSNGSSTPLINALGGSPDAGGTWSGPGPISGGNFNPGTGTPGLYTYTVQSPAPCAAVTATVNVAVNIAPQAGIGQDLDICSSQSPVDLFDELGGTPTPGGTWIGPLGLMNGTFNPVIGQPGTYTYTVTGAAPCANASSSHTITVTQAPTAGGSTAILLCPDADATDLIDHLTGTPAAGGTWSGPAGSFAGTFDPGTHPPGVYTYTVTAGPACPPASATVTITVPALPPAYAGPDMVICEMDGTLAASNNWDAGVWVAPPGVSLGDVNSPTSAITAATGGAYILTWHTTSEDGCTSSDEVQVVLTPPMSATADATGATCNGLCNGQVTVQVTGGNIDADGYSYNWASGVGSEGSAVNICAGEHQVTVVDMYGCTVIAPFTVTQPEPVAIDSLAVQRVTCVGDCDGTIMVSAPDGEAYSLNGGTTWQAEPMFEGLCAGTWVVTVRDPDGCTNTSAIAVPSPPPTIAAFHWAPSVVYASSPGVQFMNASSSDVVSYTWDLAGLGTSTEPSPFFTFPRTLGGIYPICLEVANQDDCRAMLCRELEVRDDLMGFMPNAFTPDADGLNDFFGPVFRTGEVVDMEFQIFDRWGGLVFQTTDPTERWDGQYGADPAKTGTYIWVLRYRADKHSDRLEVQGHVTLVR